MNNKVDRLGDQLKNASPTRRENAPCDTSKPFNGTYCSSFSYWTNIRKASYLLLSHER